MSDLAVLEKKLGEIKQSVVGLYRLDRGSDHAQRRTPPPGPSAFTRHAVLRLCGNYKEDPVDAYGRLYSSKAVTNPAMTTVPGWAAELTSSDIVTFLAAGPTPALYTRLAALGTTVSLAGSLSIPYPAAGAPSGGWIQEGAPVPVISAAITALKLTPRKVASISVFSDELRRRSTPEIERVVEQIMRANLSRIIDATLVSDQPSDVTRPAGLRFGIAALPAGTSMTADLAALACAVLAAGGTSVAFLVNPVQGLYFGTLPGDLGAPVLASPEVPAGTVIALDPTAFVSGIGDPRITRSNDTTLALLDNPSGSLMATPPVASLLQQDLSALRVIFDASWGLAGGRLAWMEDVTW